MEEWLGLIGNVGFPIAVAGYLLVRMEAKLDKLTEAISGLSTIVSHKKIKVDS